jgi:hypothetical protein
VVNQKDDHKGLGLRPRFLRYLFAKILVALRAPGGLLWKTAANLSNRVPCAVRTDAGCGWAVWQEA